MKLSIVIVSYNVLSFIRQCLLSIEEACHSMNYEIIIIDNNSKDGSGNYLESIQSDQISVLLNKVNRGFGAAMNQGFEVAKGSEILILNPDTLISRQAIERAVDFIQKNDECGAVGVRMMDGHGRFLKESKRGFPSWSTALFKMLGLDKIFPRSPRFASYYQGHLEEKKNTIVPILTGAFMLTRKEIIDKLGGFDEQYFMYGEDIDLSHRINQLGYYNYYLGEESIVHFKGESTNQDKISTSYNFYHSMLLFARKFYPAQKLFLLMLTGILWILGIGKWLGQKSKRLLKPVIHFGLYWYVFQIISMLWAGWYFKEPGYYSGTTHNYLLLAYAVILVFTTHVRFSGHKIFHPKRKALIVGLLIILMLYGLLPETIRSSRAIIVIGTGFILFFEEMSRLIQTRLSLGQWQWQSPRPKALLLGNFSDCLPSLQALKDLGQFDYQGIVSESVEANPISITDFDHLHNYLSDHDIAALTLHMESISMDRIMQLMTRLGSNYQYLLFSNKSMTVVDSPSSRQRGFVTTLEIAWNIDSLENRIIKRAADLSLSILFTFFSPILIWRIDHKLNWISNIYKTLIGKLTWVGYNLKDKKIKNLPKLKHGVLQLRSNEDSLHLANKHYARNYTLAKDLELIFTGFKKLGNQVKAHA